MFGTKRKLGAIRQNGMEGPAYAAVTANVARVAHDATTKDKTPGFSAG